MKTKRVAIAVTISIIGGMAVLIPALLLSEAIEVNNRTSMFLSGFLGGSTLAALFLLFYKWK